MGCIEKRVSPVTGKISYRAKVRVKGYPPEYATFNTKTAADRWAQRTEADLREDRYFPNSRAKKYTVGDLIDRYLESLRATNPRRHDEIKPMLDWWKVEVGQAVLSHFRGEQVLKAQQKLLGRQKQRKGSDGSVQTLSPATVNRYTQTLLTAVNFGIKPLKWIKDNPVRDVDKLKEPPGRTRFLSEAEIKRLIESCRASKNPYLFAVVIIGIATGARRKEIQFMKWVDVNKEGTLVTLPKTKNGDVRSVPLTGVAAEIVNRMRDEKEEDQLFLFPSPNDPGRPIDFESAWRHALTTAKIKDFRFHDLRHTCGSYLAMNGASAVEIAEALGHKTLQMARRYAHVTQTHTSSVVAKMTEKVLGHVEI